MPGDTHGVHYSTAARGTGRDDWRTPREMFLRLNDEFGFSCDAAAAGDSALCEQWIGPAHPDPARRDALTTPWGAPGEAAWLNPPYSRLRPFLARAVEQARQGVTVVALIPARTDTRAWHESAMLAHEVRLVRGRVRFVGAAHGAPFPSAIVIWRADDRQGLACVSWCAA